MQKIAGIDAEAALIGREEAEREYDASIGITYYGLAQYADHFRAGVDMAAREDWVGAWLAFGNAWLAVRQNRRNTLLKG
jgi:hypothetical protein